MKNNFEDRSKKLKNIHLEMDEKEIAIKTYYQKIAENLRRIDSLKNHINKKIKNKKIQFEDKIIIGEIYYDLTVYQKQNEEYINKIHNLKEELKKLFYQSKAFQDIMI